MLDSRGKTKGGWFFILGFNMLKPNMSNTISIGTCSSDLYIHYFFETSGTASCGTTGINTTKVSLNSYENKRYWTTSVDSLAYGHFKINELKNE